MIHNAFVPAEILVYTNTIQHKPISLYKANQSVSVIYKSYPLDLGMTPNGLRVFRQISRKWASFGFSVK